MGFRAKREPLLGKPSLQARPSPTTKEKTSITPAIDQSTSRCVQFIKGGYSFAARNQSPGEIWHSGYHEHRVRDAEDLDTQLRYIANNPSRKEYEDYPHVHTKYS